ncbi:MAG: hypothetical protein H6627_09080 [Calditrichae bacterium]|nr:hypothetical protein [Calditrichota bacterium]MCB9058707.1 hypothetical protein [Calditrichia bacterium]
MTNILKIILLILICNSVFAQNFNAKSLSMAHSITAFGSGTDAMSFNPARLALEEKNNEFAFLSIYSGISNSSISVADYNRYFTYEGHHGEAWDANDEKAILDLMPTDGLGVSTNLRVNIFTLALNNMGFSVDVIGSGGVKIKSREALGLLFDLNFTEDFKFEKPEIASGAFYAATKYSFAYAQEIKTDFGLRDLDAFAVAAKFSYLSGNAVYEIQDSDASYIRSSSSGMADEDVGFYRLNLRARRAYPAGGISAGSGFGLDLSAAAIYDKKWNFAVSLENLFAFINWNTNAAEVRFFKSDSVFLTSNDDVDRSVETDTTIEKSSFSTTLPANLYIAASYQILNNLTLTAQWRQGLTEDFGNSVIPEISAGAEYKVLSWLPLRGGISVGGRNQFLLGLGTGLDFEGFKFNISYAMREALWPTYSNGIYTAIDFRVGL